MNAVNKNPAVVTVRILLGFKIIDSNFCCYRYPGPKIKWIPRVTWVKYIKCTTNTTAATEMLQTAAKGMPLLVAPHKNVYWPVDLSRRMGHRPRHFKVDKITSAQLSFMLTANKLCQRSVRSVDENGLNQLLRASGVEINQADLLAFHV